MSGTAYSDNQDYKTACQNTSEHGHACYDLKPDQGEGHITLYEENGLYELYGRIDGIRVNASGSETEMPLLLEELNISPESGWYSL